MATGIFEGLRWCFEGFEGGAAAGTGAAGGTVKGGAGDTTPIRTAPEEYVGLSVCGAVYSGDVHRSLEGALPSNLFIKFIVKKFRAYTFFILICNISTYFQTEPPDLLTLVSGFLSSI